MSEPIEAVEVPTLKPVVSAIPTPEEILTILLNGKNFAVAAQQIHALVASRAVEAELKQTMEKSPIYCEHANEMPSSGCPCDADCYCKDHSCKSRTTTPPDRIKAIVEILELLAAAYTPSGRVALKDKLAALKQSLVMGADDE